MTEQLTPQEAWSDFALWLPLQDKWKEMSRSEKQALDKTTRMVAKGNAGMRRITAAFNRYAPGRYKFHQKEWVTKNETILQDNV